MRRLKVLFDCDGVLRQFTGGALKVVARVTGRHHDVSEVTRYDFCEALGLSRDEARAVKQAIGVTRGFASSLDVYPDAVGALRAIRAVADVRVVTSPWNSNDTWTSDTEKWLYQNFGIPFVHVHHTHDKASIFGDVFVDDKLEHVREWKDAWPSKTAVFWRTPHNAHESTPDGAVSMNRWDSLVNLITHGQEVLRGVA